MPSVSFADTVLLTAYPTRYQCQLCLLYYLPRILHAVSAICVICRYCITDRVSYTLSVPSCRYCITDRVSYLLSVPSVSFADTVFLTAYPTRCQCHLCHLPILYYLPLLILHAVGAICVICRYCIADRVSYTLSVPSVSFADADTRYVCHLPILYYLPRILHAVSAICVICRYCITDRVSYTLSVPSVSFADTVLLTAYPTRYQCHLCHLPILYY